MKKHGPVNTDLALGCVKNYHETFKSALDPRIKKAFTSDVVFDRLELIEWLNLQKCPTVNIALGIYTEEFTKKYPTAKKDRLTTFLMASNGTGTVLGDPPPDSGSDDDGGTLTLNLGDLHP